MSCILGVLPIFMINKILFANPKKYNRVRVLLSLTGPLWECITGFNWIVFYTIVLAYGDKFIYWIMPRRRYFFYLIVALE